MKTLVLLLFVSLVSLCKANDGVILKVCPTPPPSIGEVAPTFRRTSFPQGELYPIQRNPVATNSNSSVTDTPKQDNSNVKAINVSVNVWVKFTVKRW